MASPTAERPQPRPRSKSGFSFKSDKSRHSWSSAKDVFKDSSSDKRRSGIMGMTKANPNAAMNEAQPVAAALEEPTIASLRSVQHNDIYGNPISEPDLSNPTRPRWERPLDTIRSFEAAIDVEYKRRSQFRPETMHEGYNNFASRRSSYYGGDFSGNANRMSGMGGYNNYRGGRESFAEGYGPSSMGGPPRSRHNPRMQSEPTPNRYNNGQNGVYPSNGYQQSRDTVNTGGSTGSQSDPMGYSTDPSSDNSSVDRPMAPPKQEPIDNYGFTGFGGAPQYNGPILEEYSTQSQQHQIHQQQYQQQHPQSRYGAPPSASASYRHNPLPPPPPPHGYLNGGPRPLAPSSGNAAPQHPATLQRGASEKRKSWFKRRFSKS